MTVERKSAMLSFRKFGVGEISGRLPPCGPTGGDRLERDAEMKAAS